MTMRLPENVLDELLDEYFRAADTRPWSRGTSLAWSQVDGERLTDAQRSVARFITFIEDHIPGYFKEHERMFPLHGDVELDEFIHNRTLYHFSVKWAQEEDAHAHVLQRYLVTSGIRTRDELVRELAVEGRKPFHLDYRDPIEFFTYTMVQEKATQVFYRQFAAAVDEPVLRELLALLSRDESRHFAFFSRVVEEYIRQFGDEAIALARGALRTFKMPLATTLKNYWRWSLAIADAVGGYDHTTAFGELDRVIARAQAPRRAAEVSA